MYDVTRVRKLSACERWHGSTHRHTEFLQQLQYIATPSFEDVLAAIYHTSCAKRTVIVGVDTHAQGSQ